MKSDKALWGSISILVGAVIAILALIRGVWQTWLLIGVFTLWGLWVVAVLLRPYMQQAKRRRMREQKKKKRNYLRFRFNPFQRFSNYNIYFMIFHFDLEMRNLY